VVLAVASLDSMEHGSTQKCQLKKSSAPDGWKQYLKIDNSSGVDVPGYWKDGTWNSVPAWRYPATGRTAPGTV